MTNLKHWTLALLVALAACDDDTGIPPDGSNTRRTTSTNCPVVGGSTSSGSTAIDDGDCTNTGSGTSSGDFPVDGGTGPLVPTGN